MKTQWQEYTGVAYSTDRLLSKSINLFYKHLLQQGKWSSFNAEWVMYHLFRFCVELLL